MEEDIEEFKRLFYSDRLTQYGKRKLIEYYEQLIKELEEKWDKDTHTLQNALDLANADKINNYIPVSLVKEKIEELDKKRRKFTSDNVNNFYLQEFTRKYTQKSDHDYGVFSTPETITYCTNNELLGRIEALQDLLERSREDE